ncbi:threonylcarbamoyladenosine tRNA methylthiotransferase isoform X2 [Hemicordylus capensis]|uniref:threonylcarbamoyladenosine tRNA methylthiotransferase isoform X2 n=1 Tax=Hemicordylus capensis TaxID=884348 RepID=UPI0023024763|nr:threonylcarbamoyladenosine tRNA methylthiotransferase isoform X2 [Hemicordylus capensis]
MPAVCDSFLDDIEDIVSAQDPKPHDRQFRKESIIPKVRKRNSQKNVEADEDPPSDSIIPGVQKIWIRTWGCSHNNSDGEYMAGQLAAYGYKIAENAAEADLWLLNSCTVKSPAEDHFRNSIRKAQEGKKKVVLAGCVPQAQPRQDYLQGLSIIGVQQIDRVVEVVEETIKEGVCEIWLTSEDTGAYGRDIGTDLPTLLWRLVEVIPEGALLRVGMTNPPYILEHLEEMAKILNHPRVYAFLHVPVQTASDSILMDMKREYCVADFKRVVDFLKEKVPGITIATDIICGFPGETDEDFQETMNLVGEYKFPSLFINQFYPRPGTPAAKMHQVPAQIKKQRTKELSQLFHSYNPYDHKIGERQKVLVTEESFDSKFYVAHNRFYEQVLIPKNPEFMGKMVEVDIYEAGKHFMKGHPVSDTQVFTPSITKPFAKGEVSGLTEEFRHALKNGSESKACPSAEKQKVPLSHRMVMRLPWQQGGSVLKILSLSVALLAVLIAFYYGGV